MPTLDSELYVEPLRTESPVATKLRRFERVSKVFRQHKQLVEGCLLALTLAAAFAIRMLYLDATPLWVDESESSINALTILEKGYPTDQYLGLPIFENTLSRPWPQSSEYAFRDLSYSDNHLVIYHGWLPLYAIAGSFALYGVHPDTDQNARASKHDLNERKLRTRAARLPAVLFGMGFLWAVFLGGKILYGRDAGWAALLLGAIYPWHLYLSRQARYYSAQVTLTTICCIAVWLLIKRCEWKHVWLAAGAFILLFHTHLLSFGAASAALLLSLPWILLRSRQGVRKMAAFGALTAAGTLPWLLITEFARHRAFMPSAWPLLRLPGDLIRYPPLNMAYAAPGALLALVIVWVTFCKPAMARWTRIPFLKLMPILFFLLAWAGCGYALFLVFMPAVSFATNRLHLSYWGPMLLLGAVLCAAIARLVTRRYSTIAAPALMLLIFFATGHRLDLKTSYSAREWKVDTAIFNQLASMHLDKSAKLYAGPNDHLTMTFYSGVPIQSVAPVRKSYLDSYPADIVYLETSLSVKTPATSPKHIRQAARESGHPTLSAKAAEEWSMLLRTRDYRQATLKSLAPDAEAQLETLPPFLEDVLKVHHAQAPHSFADSGLDLITRGFTVGSWSEWRTLMMYRFLDPAAHAGRHANYVERLRGAEAVILTEADTAIYRSRWHPPGVQGSVRFQFTPPLSETP